MQKDVIYIDTEDDITNIIHKVKESDGKVVALVPPKRIGAIQSAVNLKLVHRAAEQANKHLVVVTNNPALTALAGSAGIPVAKNLQSKPELPVVDEVAPEEEIIDGNALPVGEHAKLAGETDSAAGAETAGAPAAAVAGSVAALAENAKEKIGVGRGALAATAAHARTKVPNFDTFRKKLFLGIAGAILLLVFLVWAVLFAPRASIVITAKTSVSALNTKVSVGTGLTTSLQAGTIKAELKTSTKDVSVPFTATGQKDVGDKATGTVALSPTVNTKLTVYGGQSVTIPAGSTVQYNDLAFTTDTPVTFSDSNRGTTNVAVTAAASGAKYNGVTGPATSSPDGTTASFVSTAGGTDKTVAVVQQSDVDTASGNVQSGSDADTAKKNLKSSIGANYIIIDDTFKADTSGVKPSPAVGQEAPDGKATLAGTITYSIIAVPRSEAETYLNAYYAQQIAGKQDQKVYDNGIGSLSFTTPVANQNAYDVTATANGKIGPNINDAAVRDYAKGKKSGEIKVYVEAISGVQSANVTFSPFWVTTAPSNANKIAVQFNLNG